MTYQEWQRGLIALGYDLGKGGPSGKGDDGIPGRLSVQATIAFKRTHGLSATPTIGPQSLEAMRKALDPFRIGPAKSAEAKAIRLEIVRDAGGLEPLHVIEARRWIGEREVVGKGSNPRILKAIQSVGARVLGIPYTDDDIAWCGGIMAAWIATVYPAEVLPNVAVRAKSWASFGLALTAPALGAIMVYDRKGGGHVALYLGETATHWILLGGNQGNKVSIMARPKSQGDPTSIRWPRSIPLPRGGRVFTNAAGIPVGTSEA